MDAGHKSGAINRNIRDFSDLGTREDILATSYSGIVCLLRLDWTNQVILAIFLKTCLVQD